jgi:carbamoyl-phosphate synthase small subunit
MNQNTAILVLEDGSVFTGTAFGAKTEAVFELVFNTSMTGYQEIITDPSYRGQAVLFTVSHIGNVGINLEDDESLKPQVSGIVVRSLSPVVSNWRAQTDLSSWLARHGVPGISGIDTRAITRKLREKGTMRATLKTDLSTDSVAESRTETDSIADSRIGADAKAEVERLLRIAREWPGLDGRDMVMEVTCDEAYHWVDDDGAKWVKKIDNSIFNTRYSDNRGTNIEYRVIAYDFGIKENILRHLSALGASVTVVPANTTAEEVLALKPDGVFLSNGPGDPAGLPYASEAVRKLIESETPVFGICLGHQLIGRALGGETARLKFGHHGGNHPVQDLRSKQVYVTAQNHNYTVVPESLDPDEVEVTHLSLNDGSLEGVRLKNKPVYSVQFHPEAAPGPHDAHEIFAPFFSAMRERAKSR